MLGVPESELGDYTPRFNIAPTQPYFVLEIRYESRQATPGDLGPLSARRSRSGAGAGTFGGSVVIWPIRERACPLLPRHPGMPRRWSSTKSPASPNSVTGPRNARRSTKSDASRPHDQVDEIYGEEKVYSTYEIDELILDPLEDLGSLEAEPAELLTFDLIYLPGLGE